MRLLTPLLFLAAATVMGAEEPPAEKKPPPAPPTDELYDLGKSLFDRYATPEVKERFEFPSSERWDEFAGRLQHALESENLEELAAYEPEARAALAALRVLPGYEDYADWLAARLDYIEAAKQAPRFTAPVPPRTPLTPTQPGLVIPYYDLWLERIRARPLPARAEELMPVLRAAFVAEGVPPELAWLAEVESTMDPAARSPAGAKGLFQLMPETARNLGLSTFLPDDRANAEKSARAAAHYLHTLHDKFGEWPLAFAAYNAGEGRVGRLLKARTARNFADISAALPSETRMYVPKVCATIAVRTGMTPGQIPSPRRVALDHVDAGSWVGGPVPCPHSFGCFGECSQVNDVLATNLMQARDVPAHLQSLVADARNRVKTVFKRLFWHWDAIYRRQRPVPRFPPSHGIFRPLGEKAFSPACRIGRG